MKKSRCLLFAMGVLLTASLPGAATPRGVRTSDVAANGGNVDTFHLTPRNGNTAHINVNIPGGTLAAAKATLIRAAINAYRNPGQPATPVFIAGGAPGTNVVTITDALGRRLGGLSWTRRTNEKKDYIWCEGDSEEDVDDFTSIYLTGSDPSGVNSESEASVLEIGIIEDTVTLSPGDYSTLAALRTAIVTALDGIGVDATLNLDDSITFVVASDNGAIAGEDDTAFDLDFGVDDEE